MLPRDFPPADTLAPESVPLATFERRSSGNGAIFFEHRDGTKNEHAETSRSKARETMILPDCRKRRSEEK